MIKLMSLLAACVLASAAARADTGSAKIAGTAEGSSIAGTVGFQDSADGLKITARLSGVPAGEHGFHIHEFGNCGEGGKAAGGHYNPLSAPHGMVVKNGIKKAHAGDMGNITADAEGKAVIEIVLPKETLAGGKYSVGGRAVVLHEKADDFSQPLGNAGGRIACGVITIAAP